MYTLAQVCYGVRPTLLTVGQSAHATWIYSGKPNLQVVNEGLELVPVSDVLLLLGLGLGEG